MGKKIRIAYFIFTATVFLSLSAFLVFYASGYSYNWTLKKVSRTGSLYLETSPSGADIKIEGMDIEAETKKLVSRLFPGEYNVSLEKDGYYKWEKRVNIYPKETTSFGEILLFKNNSEVLMADNGIKKYIDLENGEMAYLKENGDLKKINFENKKITDLAHFETSDIELHKIQNSSKNFLAMNNQTQEMSLIFSDQENRVNPLFKKQTYGPIKNIAWLSAEDELLIQINQSLFVYDLKESKISPLLEMGMVDFYATGREIFYVQNFDNGKSLLKGSIKKENGKYELSSKIIDSAGQGENFEFYGLYNNRVAMINKDEKSVCFIKTENDAITLTRLSSQSKEISQNKEDKKFLILYDDFEIKKYDTETQKNEIITRTSSKIQKALWFPRGAGYIVFLKENGLNIMEAGNYFGQQVHSLADKVSASDFFISDSGDNLFWLDNADEKNLYYMKIR